MAYGIGIDTGGTYTDAVLYDYETKTVLASGKSPTTREDLSIGIGRALDTLPADQRALAQVVAVSTTLATNACVEGKGGRARLVIMGTDRKTMEWVGADKKYGLNYDDVLCLDTRGSFDGSRVEHPDWDSVIPENDEFFSQADALAVSELNALRNGAVCETVARDALKARYDVPLVMASELVSGLNVMERGATALLNARLLPVMADFLKAVDTALTTRGINAQQVIIRSDGSLMVDTLARERPVETILSGPAASVMGCRALSSCENALIVDMGGTTTDISILRGGQPQMSGGIRIGGWRTQVKGVFIDTLGLGGDTRVYIKDHRLTLDTRRVEPLCVAASKWPAIKDELAGLLEQTRPHSRPLHEFLYLIRRPDRIERFSDQERRLIELLSDGPQMIGGEALNIYGLNSDRLEREGVVMRCGLTPTDFMHIRGDYSVFDAEASTLAARYFLKVLAEFKDDEASMAKLCDRVYGFVKRRLFENIARVFVETAYPELCKGGVDDQIRGLIARRWEKRNEPENDGFFALKLDARAALVGIGAPIHLFLPDVARILGVQCVIPEHSAVANAIGAVVADISARVSVEIRSGFDQEGNFRYTVHERDMVESFEDYDQAIEGAKVAAKRLAVAEARGRGALGDLTVEAVVDHRLAEDRDGASIDLGTVVHAVASGRLRG